jgi:hypothetical protein
VTVDDVETLTDDGIHRNEFGWQVCWVSVTGFRLSHTHMFMDFFRSKPLSWQRLQFSQVLTHTP